MLMPDEQHWMKSADLLRTRESVEAKKERWRRITRNPRGFHADVSSEEMPYQIDGDG